MDSPHAAVYDTPPPSPGPVPEYRARQHARRRRMIRPPSPHASSQPSTDSGSHHDLSDPPCDRVYLRELEAQEPKARELSDWVAEAKAAADAGDCQQLGRVLRDIRLSVTQISEMPDMAGEADDVVEYARTTVYHSPLLPSYHELPGRRVAPVFITMDDLCRCPKIQDVLRRQPGDHLRGLWGAVLAAYAGSQGLLRAHLVRFFAQANIACRGGADRCIAFACGADELSSVHRATHLLQEADRRRLARLEWAGPELHGVPAECFPARWQQPLASPRAEEAVWTLAEVIGNEGYVTIVDGRVYDCDKLAEVHPGGEHLVKLYRNADASEAFTVTGIQQELGVAAVLQAESLGRVEDQCQNSELSRAALMLVELRNMVCLQYDRTEIARGDSERGRFSYTAHRHVVTEVLPQVDRICRFAPEVPEEPPPEAFEPRESEFRDRYVYRAVRDADEELLSAAVSCASELMQGTKEGPYEALGNYARCISAARLGVDVPAYSEYEDAAHLLDTRSDEAVDSARQLVQRAIAEYDVAPRMPKCYLGLCDLLLTRCLCQQRDYAEGQMYIERAIRSLQDTGELLLHAKLLQAIIRYDTVRDSRRGRQSCLDTVVDIYERAQKLETCLAEQVVCEAATFLAQFEEDQGRWSRAAWWREAAFAAAQREQNQVRAKQVHKEMLQLFGRWSEHLQAADDAPEAAVVLSRAYVHALNFGGKSTATPYFRDLVKLLERVGSQVQKQQLLRAWGEMEARARAAAGAQGGNAAEGQQQDAETESDEDDDVDDQSIVSTYVQVRARRIRQNRWRERMRARRHARGVTGWLQHGRNRFVCAGLVLLAGILAGDGMMHRIRVRQ
eukprot:TRINITY_DN11044_c0_g1_i1.p1 TRINITY_DN11044_c0_g1~~TRINITY_DN11044_c0_g1_i1.p1  ORF type:complete len:845 (+),score=196.71 TRINITY_DN11044_c0_g1_i1:67-2601(+)